MADLISFDEGPGHRSMPIKQWKVADVVAFLQTIELGHLSEAIKDNGVDGALLLELTDEELEKELGFKGLQIKKLKRSLEVGFAAATTNGSTVTASRDVAAAAAQAAAAQAAAAQAAAAQAAAAQAAAAQAAAAEASANRAATAQAAAAAQAGAAQATAARFKAAQQLLGSAAQDLQAAAGHLHKAAAHQGVETGLGLGRFRREALPVAGMAMEASAHNNCKAAHQLAEQASRRIQEARLRCPELPNIRVPDVHVVGGIVAQEIFDSTVADMVRLQKIKGAEAEIRRSLGEVQEAMQRCAATVSTAQASGAPPPAQAAAPAPAGYPPAGNAAPAYALPPDGYAPPPQYAPPAQAAYNAQPQHQGMGVGGAVLLGAAIARPGGIGHHHGFMRRW